MSELLDFCFSILHAHCHLNGNDDVDVDVDAVDDDDGTFNKMELAERTKICTQKHIWQMNKNKAAAAATTKPNENETTTEIFHGNTIIRFMVQTSF